MKIPRGMEIKGKNKDDHVLKLHRNIYGQKQAGTNTYRSSWSKTRGEVIYILYTDDSIIAGPKESQVEDVIRDIEVAGLKITREGDVQDFLGINIKRKSRSNILRGKP